MRKVIRNLETLITILVLHYFDTRIQHFSAQTAQFLKLPILGSRTNHFPIRTAHFGKWEA